MLNLYGMQGMGGNGTGFGAGGQMPGQPGAGINPLALASMMQSANVGTPFAPGGGQTPMAQMMAHAQQAGGGMPMQHPMPQGPQAAPSFAQAMGGAQQQAGANPLAAATPGQQGIQPGGAQPQPLQTTGPGAPLGLGQMLGNVAQGYTPQGYGMQSGPNAMSPSLLAQLQGMTNGNGAPNAIGFNAGPT